MTEDVAADLKQFITGIITQQTADIRQDICRIDRRLENLDTKIGGVESKVSSLEAKIGGLEIRIGGLETKVYSLGTKTDSLENKIDNGFAAIADALEDINNANEVQLNQHGKRLTRLERKVFKEDYHGPIRQT
ncbi:MAG TPA: hypothetical protein VGO07_00395 [Candidatus Saccharimonadales bacterium]|jgi:chromosome segregation ATPase|nr:hypothetical protein [Candidatus Saccharimonadales bacterium]